MERNTQYDIDIEHQFYSGAAKRDLDGWTGWICDLSCVKMHCGIINSIEYDIVYSEHLWDKLKISTEYKQNENIYDQPIGLIGDS